MLFVFFIVLPTKRDLPVEIELTHVTDARGTRSVNDGSMDSKVFCLRRWMAFRSLE
jgi:hypothetical protein